MKDTFSNTIYEATKWYPPKMFTAFEIAMVLFTRDRMEYFNEERVARELRRLVSKGKLGRVRAGMFCRINNEKCPACNGRGWFSDDMMGSSFFDCKDCKGKGIIYSK